MEYYPFSSLKRFSDLEEKRMGGIADRNERTLNATLSMSKAFVWVKDSNGEYEIILLGDIKAQIARYIKKMGKY